VKEKGPRDSEGPSPCTTLPDISGTPTASGVWTFHVTVHGIEVTDRFVLGVTSPLSVTATKPPGANHGRSYSAKVTITGGLEAPHFN
jgi:hypothetical protein